MIFYLFSHAQSLRADEPPSDGILQTYPELQKFVPNEHKSNLYFGFGVSPFTLVSGKIGFGIDFFQIHWISKPWDWEVFSASFGNALANQISSEQYFILKTAPKYQLNKVISVGPLLGIEFVSFSNVTAEINKNNEFGQPITFSSVGPIFGGAVSESFEMGKNHMIKVNEYIYRETYSVTGTNNGWQYYFNNQTSLNNDTSPISASTVFMLDVSFLY